MVVLLMLGQVLKDLDDGVDDGAEDDGDISISRMTINISKILKNLTKQSYSTMHSSNSLNSISTLRRWPMHKHFHSHLTIRRSSSINRCDCRGRHFNVSLRRHSSLQPWVLCSIESRGIAQHAYV